MIKQIALGLKTYTTSFGLLSKLGLWKYFGIPILISVVVGLAIGFSAYGFADNIGHWVAKLWPWEWGAKAFFIVAEILSAILILTIGFIIYKHTVMALSAPFMSPVSEKIEAHLLDETDHAHRKTTFTGQLWRGIYINVRNLIKELLLTIPILLLGFIPIIGSTLSTILLFIMQSYYAGFGNMDYTLERHFNYKESVVFVQRNRGYAIGNGMVFMALLIIPILGFIIVLPLTVTAASQQTVEIIRQESNQNSALVE